jgi:hypothetical protein
MAKEKARQREMVEEGRRLWQAGRVEFVDGSAAGLAWFAARDFDGRDREVVIDTRYGVVQCDCPEGRPADHIYGSSYCSHAEAATMLRAEMLAGIEAA